MRIKYISKPLFYSIILFCFSFFAFNVNGQQAHQGELYVDCEGATCLTDEAAIQNLIDNMTRGDGTKIVTNVMLFSKDCGHKPMGSQLVGPEVNGNALWYDSSVDYLIVIEPGKVRVYENNNFLPPFIIFSNSNQVEGVMNNILNTNFSDYSSKHQCMIVEGLSKIQELEGGSPISSPTSCSSGDVVVDESYIILDGNTGFITTPWISNIQPIIQRFISNYCTNIVIYESYGITGQQNLISGENVQANILESIKQSNNLLDKNVVLFYIRPPFGNQNSFGFNLIYQSHDNPNQSVCLPQYYNLAISNDIKIVNSVEEKSETYKSEYLEQGIREGLLKLEAILKAVDDENAEDKPLDTDCPTLAYESISDVAFSQTDFYKVHQDYNVTNTVSMNNLTNTETIGAPNIYNGLDGTPTVYDYAGLDAEMVANFVDANNMINTDRYFNKKAVSIITSSENLTTFIHSSGVELAPTYNTAVEQWQNYDMSSPSAPDVLHLIYYDNVSHSWHIRLKYHDSFMSVSIPDPETNGPWELSTEEEIDIASARNEMVGNCVGLSPSETEMQYGNFQNTGTNNPSLLNTEFNKFGFMGSSFWTAKVNASVATLRQVVEYAKIPEVVWAQEGNSNNQYDEQFIIKIPPYVSGVGDGVADELRSIPDLVVLAASFATDAKTREGIKDLVKNPMKMFTSMKENLLFQGSASIDVKQHGFAQEGTGMVFMVIGGPAAILAIIKAVRKKGAKRMTKELANQIKAITTDPALKQSFTNKMKNYPSSVQDNLFKFVGKFSSEVVKDKIWNKLVRNHNLIDLWDRLKDVPITELDLKIVFEKLPPSYTAFFYESSFFNDLLTGDLETLKKFLKDIQDTNVEDFMNHFASTPKLVEAWKVVDNVHPSSATDIGILQKMSNNILVEPSFELWIKNNPQHFNTWKTWQTTYNSLGDPVKGVLGSGRVSHASEWNQLISEIESAGGEVIFSPGRIAYSPGVKKGVPGQLIIDQDASITALRHEHRHFIDDQTAGYRGFEGVYDPNFRINTEFNAYKLEVEEMLNLGETGVATQLKNNFLEEVNSIKAAVGLVTDPTVEGLIDILMNL